MFALATISVIALTLSVGVVAMSAQKESWEQITLAEEYMIDDSLALPSRTVTVGGKNYDSSVKIYYPDGSAFMKTDTFTSAKLDQAGVYKLTFDAKDEAGARYYDERSFTVADKLWRVAKEKSSVFYGHDPLASEGTQGLLVKLAKGDTLTFGKLLDLSEIDLNTVLVSGFITPSVQGSYDFDRLVFTFTDAFDPEITLSIQGRRSLDTAVHAAGISYWMAWGNGQTGSGFENDNFHHGDIWGTSYAHSFLAMSTGRGEPNNLKSYPQPSDYNQFRLRFDPIEVNTYVSDLRITDLDDPLLHEGENIWKGFKSNQVKLTVSAYDLQGETANFCITSVLGYDLTSENKFIESDGPEITLDAEEGMLDANGNMIPPAVVGGTYPVLNATAIDAYSGVREVSAVVYYNYANPAARTTCIIENGRFRVNNVGKYTVEYTAKDAMGNETKLLCGITSVKRLSNPLTVTAPEAPETVGVCGQSIVIPEPEVAGGSGTVSVRTYAILSGEVIEINKNTFFPEKAGEWTIKYVASDITELTAEDGYVLTVSASDKPVFEEVNRLPKYLISGMKHVVPEILAADYSTGTKKIVTATVTVTDKNGSKEYKAGDVFVPEVANNLDEVVLTVKAGTQSMEKRIPAVVCFDDGLLLMERMFAGENFTAVKTDSGLEITAATSGTVGWTYAGAVAAKNSSVTIEGVKGKDDFSALEVTFTDSLDEKIAVTAKIVNVKGKNAKVCFGDTDREITQGFASAGSVFEIGFNGSAFTVGKTTVNVSVDDLGETFNGFPSGKVYFTVKITDAKAGAGYVVKKVDNNSITKLSIDRTKPRISVSGDYGGMRNLGDIYVLSSAMATDTLSQALTFGLTVKTPSGEIAEDINGLSLKDVDPSVDYSLKLTMAGQYSVYYLAVDEEGNEGELLYTVNILDKVAPVVKLGNGVKTAKVGDTIVLPDVTVSDDVTPSEKIVIYRTVRDPNGVLVVLGFGTEEKDGKTAVVRYSYTFAYRGEYRFFVLAMDEAGNQTLAEFVVTVE